MIKLITIFYCIFISEYQTKLVIVSPHELSENINEDEQKGSIKYSISLYGDVLYNKTELVKILIPQEKDNVFGCDELKRPEGIKDEIFVWLFKRGNCSFQKKTQNAQQTGSYAVLTYQNDDSDIDYTLPVADSICNLTRQQFINSFTFNIKNCW